MLDLSTFTGNIIVQQDNSTTHNTHNGDTHIHGVPKEEIESIKTTIQEHSHAIGGLRQGIQVLTPLKERFSTFWLCRRLIAEEEHW